MIDVRDLMIGSYLECGGDFLEVVGINGEVHGAVVFRDPITKQIKQEDRSQFLKFVSPIPITPEWLEKLGFTRNPDYEEFYPKGNENVNVTYKDDSYFFDYDCPRGVEWCRRYVEHVHQLQNHFYLMTGEELTIGGEV